MADLPSLYNTGLDALVVQLLADISLSVVQRTSFSPDKPEGWFDPENWPTKPKLLLAVADLVSSEIDPPLVELPDRNQGLTGEIRGWSVSGDKTELSELRINHIREIRNAIETVGAANPFPDGWTINWHDEAGRLDVESNRPPYAAFRVSFLITAWE